MFIFTHLQGIIVEGKAGVAASILRKYLCSCRTVKASKQHNTLWGIPCTVEASRLVETVSLLPGTAAGEGMARKPGRRVIAATAGDPILCVVIFS